MKSHTNYHLQSTFLYRSKSAGQNDTSSEIAMEKCCMMAVEKLCAFGMAKLCPATSKLKPTVPGMLMSQHYVSSDTMKKIMRLDGQLIGTATLLRMLSRCTELQHPLRRSEKAILTEINNTKVKYRERNGSNKHQVDSDEMKCNVLLQAAIGRIDVRDHSLRQEMLKSFESAERILKGNACHIFNLTFLDFNPSKAAIDFLAFKKRGQAVWTAFKLWRSMKLRAWDESGGATSLQQIEGIDASVATELEYIGIRTIRQLASASVDHLLKFIRRGRGECSELVNNASAIAQFAVSTTVENMRVLISISTSNGNQKAVDSPKQSCTILVWSNCDLLLFREGVYPPAELEVSAQSINDGEDSIHIRLMQDQFVGLDEKIDLDMSFIMAKELLSSVASKTEQTQASFFECSQEIVVEEVLVHEKRNPEPLLQDSGIMMAIKKLEMHHAKAKQQKINLYFKQNKAQNKDMKKQHLENYASTDNIQPSIDNFQGDKLLHNKFRRANNDPKSVTKWLVHRIPSDTVAAKIKDDNGGFVEPRYTQSTFTDKDYRMKRKRNEAKNEASTNPFSQFTLSNKRKVDASQLGRKKLDTSSTSIKSTKGMNTNLLIFAFHFFS